MYHSYIYEYQEYQNKLHSIFNKILEPKIMNNSITIFFLYQNI